MAKVRSFLRETRSFGRTLCRVLLINWRVSPWLYVAQVVMTVIQGLLPLLQAFLAALLLGKIAEVLTHPGTDLTPLVWLFLGIAGIRFVISQTSYLSFFLDDLFGMQFDLH